MTESSWFCLQSFPLKHQRLMTHFARYREISWDSLKHMNLITALEDEFDIRFDDDEIIALMRYSMIVATVSGKVSDA